MSDVKDMIVYLRKSQSDSPDMSVEEVVARHEEILQNFARSEYGQEIPEDQIYREVVSGETIADRPVMKNLLLLLETRAIKGVLVVEPQRLSRGDLVDCGRIINTFRYTDTLVITPSKTYNLTDEYDRKFFEMELMRGNDYLEYIKKIFERGRISSVKAGNFIGSVAPYGYKKMTIGHGKDTVHTLEIIPEEAEALRLMYHLYVNEGYGFTKIARRLDELGIHPRKSEHWSPPAIKDMLENPVYIGKIRWNWRKTIKTMVDGEIVKSRPKTKDESDWIYVDGKHEAIIDENTFKESLAKRGKNPCVRKNKELSNPFAGLLYCGTCGHAMSLKKYIDKRRKSSTPSASMICNDQAICHTKSVQYSALQERVISIMKDTIEDFEIKLKNNDDSSNKLHEKIIKNLELELKKLKEKDLRQKDAFDDGIYSKEEYLSRNTKVQEEICSTMAALENARNSVSPVIEYKERISRFTECIENLQNPNVSAKEKNMLLKTCIDKIIYTNTMESKAGIGRYVENQFELDIYFK